MDQGTLDKLYEDFTIEIKPGKGSFKYVRTRHILDRMNKAFNGNWGTHIISHSEIGDEVLVLAAVYIYDDHGHILAQQQGFGSAKKFNGVELGNTYKSATSKAIKSAVRNWGVALFLEEDGTATEFVAQPSMVQVNRAPNTTPNVGAATQGMPSMPQNTMPTINTTMPSMPKNEGTMAMPTPSTGAPVGNVATVMPGTPLSAPVANALPQMTAVPGRPTAVPNTETTQTRITSVQKVAIMSRLSSKGKRFEDICGDFYSSRPNSNFVDNIDDMTYTDALDLVSFLNSK